MSKNICGTCAYLVTPGSEVFYCCASTQCIRKRKLDIACNEYISFKDYDKKIMR